MKRKAPDAVSMAKRRWKGKTKQQRAEHAKLMNAARWLEAKARKSAS